MILFTSDIDINKKSSMKSFAIYLAVSLFCLIFGIVYEMYSHGVYSNYMVYAFLVPLVGGAIPFFAVGRLFGKLYPGGVAKKLYNSGIAVFTVGCVMKGVLEIYGTTNVLHKAYPIAGTVFLAAGICLWVANIIKRTSKGDLR